mgnify:CR=1 FL=1
MCVCPRLGRVLSVAGMREKAPRCVVLRNRAPWVGAPLAAQVKVSLMVNRLNVVVMVGMVGTNQAERDDEAKADEGEHKGGLG